MQLLRMFSTDKAKGNRGYLDSQKKYEILRTILYFAISISLFVAGYIQTGRRGNLLGVVAVLGCLPASKSAVGAIMFLRYKSCSASAAERILTCCGNLEGLFDCVFTSEKKNFMVSHLAVRRSTICGYTESGKFEENAFYQHLGGHPKLDGYKDVTVKIFTDLDKYTERLKQMAQMDADPDRTEGILSTLKNVML